MARSQTLTGSQASSDTPELGVVSGFLFKLMRGAVGQSQADLAETLGVDQSTVQGWEVGRRPLAAMRAGELTRLGRRMTLLGAPADAASMLPMAVAADEFLTTAIRAGEHHLPTLENPLASAVHRRDFVALATWPMTGIVPARVRSLPLPKSRGPVADRPQIPRKMRDRFFDQMIVSAETPKTEHRLIQRQALYLLGFDSRPETADWLVAQHDRLASRSIDARDVPSGMLSRSAALALARQGDHEPVRRLIKTVLTEHGQMLGTLTYWAYWLGEVPEIYSNDESMLVNGGRVWSGRRLLEHFLTHLTDPKNAEMNIHSLLGLVMARRGLLDSHPDLCRRTLAALERADSPALSRHARSQLADLQLAARLAIR